MDGIQEVRKRGSWSARDDSVLKEIRRDGGKKEGIASHQGSRRRGIPVPDLCVVFNMSHRCSSNSSEGIIWGARMSRYLLSPRRLYPIRTHPPQG